MITVGITGGIGSGKTTVCKIWQSLGAYILNADDLAKSIMAEDPDVKEQIVETFGPDSYRSDGSLNRAYLAEQAFGKGRVNELNAIVHPRIPAKSQEIMKRAVEQGYKVFVYEAALLLENLEPGQFDFIVIVLADRDKRLKRVRERDESAEEEIRERMDRQQNFQELTHRADYVLRNNGTVDELEQKAKKLYQELLDMDTDT